MHLGFVGAGRIGLPMVRRLTAAGHRVVVTARSATAATAVREAGAEPVEEAADVAAGADAVVVCVLTDEQVRRVSTGSGGVLAAMGTGTTLVVHTTGSPHTAELLAAAGQPRSIGVVDAPVSGGPAQVEAGAVTLFVGGADHDVAAVTPVLSCYGDPVLRVGPLGAGQRVKLVNNALFAATIGLVADAVRLGGELGVSEPALLAALPHGSGASRALALAAASGSVAALAAGAGEFLAKDLAVVREVARDLGGDLGLLGRVLEAPQRPAPVP